jgi:hypothetical protein
VTRDRLTVLPKFTAYDLKEIGVCGDRSSPPITASPSRSSGSTAFSPNTWRVPLEEEKAASFGALRWETPVSAAYDASCARIFVGVDAKKADHDPDYPAHLGMPDHLGNAGNRTENAHDETHD